MTNIRLRCSPFYKLTLMMFEEVRQLLSELIKPFPRDPMLPMKMMNDLFLRRSLDALHFLA
jgi:hypothetical protein